MCLSSCFLTWNFFLASSSHYLLAEPTHSGYCFLEKQEIRSRNCLFPFPSPMEGLSIYTVVFSVVNFKVLGTSLGFEFDILHVVCIKPL